MLANFSQNSKKWSAALKTMLVLTFVIAITGASFADEAVNIKIDVGPKIKLDDKSFNMEKLSKKLSKMAKKESLEILVETTPATNGATVVHLSRQLLEAGIRDVSFKNRETGKFIAAWLDSNTFTPPEHQNNYKYFEQNGKWGYADEQGAIIIPPTYDDAHPTFIRGWANVKLNNKWGMIDTQNNIVVPIQYEQLGHLEENRIFFKQDGKYGFLDPAGNEIILAQYDAVHFFFNGLAPVQVNGKWGYINPAGEMVIQPRFDDMQGYMEGLAPVKQNGRWGFVNANDELVIPCTYQQVNPFKGGLASVLVNGKWGYINKLNEMVIEPQFENADLFYDSRATVQVENKYGIIDKTGKMIVEPEYDMIANYHMGVCFAVTFEKPDEGIAAQNVSFDLAGNKLADDRKKDKTE